MKKVFIFAILFVLGTGAVFAEQITLNKSIEKKAAEMLLLASVKGSLQIDLYQINQTRDRENILSTTCSVVLTNRAGLLAVKPNPACLQALSKYQENIAQAHAKITLLEEEYPIAALELSQKSDYILIKLQGAPAKKIQTLAKDIFKTLHQPDLTATKITDLLQAMPEAKIGHSSRPYMDSWED